MLQRLPGAVSAPISLPVRLLAICLRRNGLVQVVAACRRPSLDVFGFELLFGLRQRRHLQNSAHGLHLRENGCRFPVCLLVIDLCAGRPRSGSGSFKEEQVSDGMKMLYFSAVRWCLCLCVCAFLAFLHCMLVHELLCFVEYCVPWLSLAELYSELACPWLECMVLVLYTVFLLHVATSVRAACASSYAA